MNAHETLPAADFDSDRLKKAAARGKDWKRAVR